MATDPLVPKRALENGYVFLPRGDTTLILKTVDTYELTDTGFATAKLRIYAETIKISKPEILLATEDVGLYCNKLILPGPYAKISVSGKKGDDVAPHRSPEAVNQGRNGGTLEVYVEELQEEALPRMDEQGNLRGLFLEAYGGDGGHPNEEGSVGGNGGNGGHISFYFGIELARQIVDLAALADDARTGWKSKASSLKAYNLTGAGAPPQLQNAIREMQLAATELDSLAHDLHTIQTRIALIRTRGLPNRVQVLEKGTAATSAIQQLFSCWYPPNFTTSTEACRVIANSKELIEQVRDATTPSDAKPWNEYMSSMTIFTQTLQNLAQDCQARSGGHEASPSRLPCAVRGVLDVLNTSASQVITNMRYHYNCRRGRAIPSAQQGSDGTTKLQMLAFTGQNQEVNIESTLVHPDECQMLANQADLFYLVATRPLAGQKPDFSKAYPLYRRLQRRLAFVPALLARITAIGTKESPPPRAKACVELDESGLSMDSLEQLIQIYSHVDTRLQQLATGQDPYGRKGLWAPRLRYTLYYQQDLELLLKRATAISQRIKDTNDKPDPADVQESIANATANLQHLETCIQYLTGDNGILKNAASQVKLYTPVLKQKRAALKEEISDVMHEIESYGNWDPRIFIDALTMVAFAPDLLNLFAQGISAGYKAKTTVTSVDGQIVEKSYVVHQFGVAQTELDQLVMEYQTHADGTVDVDDPGATKLLATRETLTKLLTDYKVAIKASNNLRLTALLDEYAALVLKRNNAVMEYNSGVRVLAKQVGERKCYERRKESLGQLEGAIDPLLPQLRFFLLKTRYHILEGILEMLYQAERALQFWTLMDDLQPLHVGGAFSDSADDIQLLCRIEDNFHTTYKKYMTRFAGNPGQLFPHPSDPTPGGVFHHLDGALVNRFINNRVQVMTDSSGVKFWQHQLFFNIPAVRRATGIESSAFAGQADIRLDQVRVWLLGAKVAPNNVGKYYLRVDLTHCGNDSIVQPEKDKLFEFEHDTVHLTFDYDPTSVSIIQETSEARIYAEQRLASFRHAQPGSEPENVAPVGPFADWRLTVSEQYNAGLDLHDLTDIVLEFWGSSRNFLES